MKLMDEVGESAHVLVEEHSYKGHIDELEGETLTGWLCEKGSMRPVEFLVVTEEDEIVGEGLADQFRPDLAEAGIGEGKHSFSTPILPHFFNGRVRTLRLQVRGDNTPVPGALLEIDTASYAKEVLENLEDILGVEAEAETHEGEAAERVEGESEKSTRLDEAQVDEAQAVKESYVGRLDHCQYGRVSGWLHQVDSSESVAFFVISDDGTVVAEGIANQFRADLAKANVGKGKHSFSFPVTPSFFNGELRRLRLQVRENRFIIPDAELEVDTATRLEVHALALDEFRLQGNFSIGVEGPDELAIAVCIDKKMQHTCTAYLEGAEYSFSYFIDPAFFDGSLHTFQIALLNEAATKGMLTEVLQPIKTAWQYLTNAHNTLDFSALPQIAAYRYRSLQHQLENVQDLEAIQRVYKAHEQVLLGHEFRRQRYEPLILPEEASPVVSIIVAAHENFSLTYHCIASLILAYNKCPFELIIIDDASSQETQSLYAAFQNVRIMVNDENLGFLRSCKKAAAEAKGRYLFFLNNDTEVTSGFLDECLDAFKLHTSIGLVGSKLIYPNGRLQEAGGIVWQDGRPWNVGHGANPLAPEYSYHRRVDYVSGAALMITAELWQRVGGFSEEFAPAYYEDTDLAFKVRELGLDVLYCSSSEVIHHEGMSNGKNTDIGIKRFQKLNAPKFRNKWFKQFQHNGVANPSNLWLHKDRGVRYRALVLDQSTPKPDIDAGGYAAVQEIKVLLALGFKVSFIPGNLAHLGHYTKELQRLGVECLHYPFINSIYTLLEKRGHEFDLVYITRYTVAQNYLQAVREHTSAKVLFNNADLHFLREMRSALKQEEPNIEAVLQTRESELGVIKAVDAVFCYNKIEHAIIMSHTFKEENLFLCPWVLEPEDRETVPSFESREGIAFLGSFGHPPNREAVEYFLSAIAKPLFAELPDLKLHIYGSNMPKDLVKSATDNVVVEGYVRDLEDVYNRHRLFISPLISGAGIKGKVLNALAFGVPSVISPVSAEGTGITSGVQGIIAETVEEWVNGIKLLYLNQERWQQASHNSLSLATRHYSFENAVKQFRKALDYLELYTV